ncbi:unnamed protein product [Lota lota]
MVYDVYLLLVLLLTTSFIFAGVSKETCDIHALVGQSLTLALDQKMLSMKDVLRWTHNKTVIFYRTSALVRTGKPTDVNAAGSLQLRGLSFSSAGDYKADVLNETGARINGWIGHVCVMEKVSTPEATFLCGSSGAVATLNCNVLNPRDVLFEWTHDGQLLKGETKPTLSVSLATFTGDKDFSCRVRNAASDAQSNAVRLKCKPPPPPPPPKIYCFKASTVMAAVTGGGGLILLLLIITIVSCYRQKKEAKPVHQADLPMVPTTKTDHVTSEYEIMHPSGDSRGLSPSPSPTAQGQDVILSVAKAQGGLRTTSPEEKRGPSPVPKPRTKAPEK